jgi:CheY-like chemotaxis protein/nitrogen-specific signal transduction histidine kinase
MVIATVVSLDCLMLYFYVRKVADYKQRSTAYMRELEQTKQAISRFVRESSHQIRIDLNGVSGALQHALAGTTKMDAMEQVPVPLKHLRAMYNGSNAVIDHINNALEWARIEQGLPFPIKKEAFDLHGWLDDMTERFRLLAENKPANLVLTQDGDLPKNIIEDKNRLGAIIGNLLANAIKFTHKHTTVTFDAAVREDNLLFSVTDQGKGMSAEQQIAVFEPFVTEANELVQGTGLGLPVARDLVQALGGTMEIYSTPGSGTTFIVRLPLTIAEATEVASVLSDLPEDFKGYSTLVVEDDYTSRMVTFAILKRTSMEVYTAETAAEAMRKLAYYKIDIVLLDFNLPDSNGLEVLKWIKTNPALKHVHVVFASAEAYRGGYSDKQKLAMDAGASAYMYKPLKFDELLLEFKRLLYSDIYTE